MKSLNTMCNEVNLPLSRQVNSSFRFVLVELVSSWKKRNETEMRSVRKHWNELGHICADLNRFRPVYSAKDFLDVISVLSNPNLKIDETIWKCVFPPLRSSPSDLIETNRRFQFGSDQSSHRHEKFRRNCSFERQRNVSSSSLTALARLETILCRVESSDQSIFVRGEFQRQSRRRKHQNRFAR